MRRYDYVKQPRLPSALRLRMPRSPRPGRAALLISRFFGHRHVASMIYISGQLHCHHFMRKHRISFLCFKNFLFCFVLKTTCFFKLILLYCETSPYVREQRLAAPARRRFASRRWRIFNMQSSSTLGSLTELKL